MHVPFVFAPGPSQPLYCTLFYEPSLMNKKRNCRTLATTQVPKGMAKEWSTVSRILVYTSKQGSQAKPFTYGQNHRSLSTSFNKFPV